MQGHIAEFYHSHHHQILDYMTEAVAVCSVLHTTLPPYDWTPDFVTTGLAEFPSAQKLFHAVFNNRYYRLAIYVIGYVALNARTTIWRSLSINNPKSANASQQTLANGKDKP